VTPDRDREGGPRVPTLPSMTIDPAPETDARPASGDGDVTIDAPSVTAPVPVVAGAAAASSTEAPPSAPPSSVAPVAAAVAVGEARDADDPSAGRRRSKRVKARKVERVVTRVDPWSMLKISLLFAVSLWLIVVVAGVLIWRVAVSTGTIPKFENFLAQTLGEDSFTINGGQVFQGSVVVGAVFFVTGAVFAVVTSVLFNLIAGLVGGIRFTMVELETARPVADGPDSA